jgi:hypothetical protein
MVPECFQYMKAAGSTTWPMNSVIGRSVLNLGVADACAFGAAAFCGWHEASTAATATRGTSFFKTGLQLRRNGLRHLWRADAP